MEDGHTIPSHTSIHARGRTRKRHALPANSERLRTLSSTTWEKGERNRTNEDGEGVFVRPSVIVEATYQEIQETGEYTSGFALRVPKIVRFRTDKTISEIDTVEKLQRLYEFQYERYPVHSI